MPEEAGAQSIPAVAQEFALTREQLLHESGRVAEAIAGGLRGDASPFLLAPSFLGLPDGKEFGEFLALDFGGSNLRLARIRLERGDFWASALKEWSLSELLSGRDGRAEDLFFRIAKEICVLAGSRGGCLGHTFSYPAVQTGVNTAILQSWTKEMALTGAETIDVNGLLRRKLLELGRGDIIPSVVLNDTVAVLLAASYQSGCSGIIGSICGTGHNSCYYEPQVKTIINLESGNFSPACRNRFDRLLDKDSVQPGRQQLEKMSSGNYLAKLTVLAGRAAGIGDAGPVTAAEVAAVLDDTNNAWRPLARAVISRAAQIVAAEYNGICAYLREQGVQVEKIAIDGSIYNKVELFKRELAGTLNSLAGRSIEILPSSNSSLYGAAVACALLTKR